MVNRTLWRLGAHVLHVSGDLLGDDWVGRTLRRRLLRLFGAHVAAGSTLHGGTYLTHPSRLRVGARCFVNRNCYFDLGGDVTLADDVTIGHGVTFITTRHEMGESTHRAGATTVQSISVGVGAWIGANATVLPGVKIGSGAVVAAGAVVVNDVDADSLVAGVPARLLRHLPTQGPTQGPTGSAAPESVPTRSAAAIG